MWSLLKDVKKKLKVQKKGKFESEIDIIQDWFNHKLETPLAQVRSFCLLWRRKLYCSATQLRPRWKRGKSVKLIFSTRIWKSYLHGLHQRSVCSSPHLSSGHLVRIKNEAGSVFFSIPTELCTSWEGSLQNRGGL